MTTFRLVPAGKLAVPLAAITVFALAVGPTVPNSRYTYDEADYMFAVSQGFLANYWDTPSIAFAQFVRLGLKRGLEPKTWTSLSSYIRETGDVSFYRHYHGPLYFYWLQLGQMVLPNSEVGSRWASLVLLVMASLMAYLGCRWLLNVDTEDAALAAILASGLVLFGTANIRTAMQITPHSLYVLMALASLLFMARLLQTGDSKHWFGSIVVLAFAFMTIEYAILLLVTFIGCVIFKRHELFPDRRRRDVWRRLAKSGVVFIGVLLLLWPAGVLKLTILKNYIYFTYFAFVRSEAAYGSPGALSAWWSRLIMSPIEYAILLVLTAAGLYRLLRLRERVSLLLPFYVYAGLLVLTTFRNQSLSQTYLSSLFPVVYVGGALALAGRAKLASPFARYSILGGAAALIAASAVYSTMDLRSEHRTANEQDVVVSYLGSKNLDGSVLLVPQQFVPTLHYYFPQTVLKPYQDGDPALILDRLTSEGIDGLLYSGVRNLRARTGSGTGPNDPTLRISEPVWLTRDLRYYSIWSDRRRGGRPGRVTR